MSTANGHGSEAPVGLYTGRSLKDELSSLRIERKPARPARPTRSAGRRGGGLGLLSTLLWLIPLGLLGGGGYYAYTQYQKIRPRPTVTTTLVRELSAGEARTLLTAKGYLTSRYQAMIGAKMPGRVEQIQVEEGSVVEEGELLAVLEHDDLKALLASREAMVARSRAELEEMKADLDLKRIQADRSVRLRAAKQNSEEEKEQALAAYRMAAAKVDALMAGIKLQEAMVAEAEASIEDMHIVAPFAGTVIEKAAEVGETITPGGMGAASGRGSVVTLANLKLLEVETDIAENQLARVSIGQPAEIAVSAVPSKRYKGRLRRVIPMGDRARGTIKVYVEVLDPDENLFPELLANVYFLPEGHSAESEPQRSLYMPKSALIESGGQTFAWVVDGQGKVHRTAVKATVEDQQARVEEGLSAAQKVVVSPPDGLVDGEAVQFDD